MDVGDKLKKYRIENNLTQADIAGKLNVSRKTISGWENKRSYPDVNSLLVLSELYNVSIDSFLKEDETILENYKEQSQIVNRNDRIAKISYFINIILWILGYAELFHLFGLNQPIIELLLLANIVIFILQYNRWNKINNKKSIVSIVLVFFGYFIINVVISIITVTIDYHLISNEDFLRGFIIGAFVGKFILVFLLSISFIIIIFLNNKFGSKKAGN